jgi:hypothetical protein
VEADLGMIINEQDIFYLTSVADDCTLQMAAIVTPNTGERIVIKIHNKHLTLTLLTWRIW